MYISSPFSRSLILSAEIPTYVYGTQESTVASSSFEGISLSIKVHITLLEKKERQMLV